MIDMTFNSFWKRTLTVWLMGLCALCGFAQEEGNAEEYVSVTLVPNYGRATSQTVLVRKGTMLSDTITATRTRAVFKCWYADADCQQAYEMSTPLESDTTLYAGWRFNTTLNRQGWEAKAYANPSWALEKDADGRVSALLDNNSATFFHSNWEGSAPGKGMPQAFMVDMKQSRKMTGISLLGRSNSTGFPLQFRAYVSDTPLVDLESLTSDTKDAALSVESLGEATYSGQWTASTTTVTADFDAEGRYVLFVADETVKSDANWLCVSEFWVNALQDTLDYHVTITGSPEGALLFKDKAYRNGDVIQHHEYITSSNIAAVVLEGYYATFTILDRELILTYHITPVYEWTEFVDDKLYYIDNKRGALVWDGSANKLTSTTKASLARDYNDPKQQFMLARSNKDSLYVYIYNVAAGKFVGRQGTEAVLSDSPQHDWKMKTSMTSGYRFMIDSRDGKHFNVAGANQISVDSWGTEDNGNVFNILPVGPADPEVAQAVRNAATLHFSKNFECGTQIGAYSPQQLEALLSSTTFEEVELWKESIEPNTLESGRWYRIYAPGSTHSEQRPTLTATPTGATWQAYDEEDEHQYFKVTQTGTCVMGDIINLHNWEMSGLKDELPLTCGKASDWVMVPVSPTTFRLAGQNFEYIWLACASEGTLADAMTDHQNGAWSFELVEHEDPAQPTAVVTMSDKLQHLDAPIFDLSGRRMTEAVRPGIYIRAGRKFVVK